MSHRTVAATLLALAGLAAASTALAGSPNVNAALADVRAFTADFHDIEIARGAGWNFQPNPLCVQSPVPGEGGMGYHYMNAALTFDTTVDPQMPEVLVYAPSPSGGLRLVAVEWIAPRHLQPTAPTLFGQTFHFNGHVGGPQGAWILHAWVWEHNPAGMFADFNPRVSCD